ncbi:thiamine pyrophosphate enzyme, central domain protein [Mycobacterium xenopi 4042]|uniref:Thiamine pyrophosphate enzyme, central domain protein n=1 Tax=Mycobacterium xenopi 4042 TaxID=1299334 RepID=X8CJA1_MYCXE|nr:thiamine pyrophosphate enzyme, central domain protein [Mycobacterium xenopi 4042]
MKALAELMACPVIQTSGGTSYIPGLEDRTFPYGFSAAAVEAVTASDLCVALGTELGEPVHYGRTRHWAQNDPIRKWIYVEQDPTAIGVNRPVDVALVGDLRAVVPQLVDALGDSPAHRRPTWPAGSSRTPTSWLNWLRPHPAAKYPSIPRVSWSRQLKLFRPRAFWCATAVQRSSSSGPIRRPNRATSSGTRTSATSAPGCPMPSALRWPTAASDRSCCSPATRRSCSTSPN